MTLGDRVPVNPLDEVRLERIEQRIVRAAPTALARPARPTLLPWALTATTAAAAALAVVALRRPSPPAPAPVAVTTDAKGARVDLGDAVVAVGPDTQFAVTRPHGGVDVALVTGTVTLEVAPRHNRPPLWVHAGEVGVRVVGTGFTVHRDHAAGGPGPDRVEVAVDHGVVEVHRGAAVARVNAGERWSSDDGTVIAVAETGAGTETGTGTGTGTGGSGGSGSIGGGDGKTGALATGPGVDVALLGDHRAAVPVPGGTENDRRAVTDRGDRRAPPPGGGSGSGSGSAVKILPADPLVDLRARIVGSRLAPAIAASSASPAEAVAEYQKKFATSADSAEASAALYSLARTQHVMLGKDGDALKNLDAYLRRFPRGPELESVLWLRLRVLCKKQFDEPCRAAAHTYADRYQSTATYDRGHLAELVTKSP